MKGTKDQINVMELLEEFLIWAFKTGYARFVFRARHGRLCNGGMALLNVLLARWEWAKNEQAA